MHAPSAAIALLVVAIAGAFAPTSGGPAESPGGQAPDDGRGVISGVVVNERREPVGQVQMQAFPAPAIARYPADRPLLISPAGGLTVTDSEGRFRITGLEPGEYVVAAEVLRSLLPPGSPLSEPQFYAATFHPSVIDPQKAARVVLSPGAETATSIELVPARGARVAGTVTPPSGRSTAGMSVGLYHRFGGTGGGRRAVTSVGVDGSFKTPLVPPGWYRLIVTGASELMDRNQTEFAEEPFVATRITVDGVDRPLEAGVELSQGSHEIVLTIGPFKRPARSIGSERTAAELVKELMATNTTYEVAEAIAARGDVSVPPTLEPWLRHENRQRRALAAFIFASRGDVRGFETLVAIVNDRSERPFFRIPGGPEFQQSIARDRAYAIGLLGELRDSRAVPDLAPLLRDPEVVFGVPGALGKIGGPAAIAALLTGLDDPDPSIRVLAIYALETAGATEALPRLRPLVNDREVTSFGSQVSVAAAAKAAIAALEAGAR